MKEKIQNAMRNIPSMDRLLSMPWIGKYETEIGRDYSKIDHFRGARRPKGENIQRS